ncbi:MAG: hypothetical protein JWN14_3546 [Chthonomonadales bacterium]|nr:hypothetical protein [Chthonomonadales bacterium]
MFRRIESTETSAQEGSVLPLASSENTLKEAATPAQNLDVELAELATCVEEGFARRKRYGKNFLKGYFTYTGVFIALDLVWMFEIFHGILLPTSLPNVLLLCFAVLSLPTSLIGGLLWLSKDRTTRQEINAIQRLAEIDDPRATALLINALGWTRNRELRPLLWQTLERRFLTMTEDEALALDKQKQYCLAAWVQGWDIPLNRRINGTLGNQALLGLLHVLALMGQASFQSHVSPFRATAHLLPTLKKWAEGKESGKDPAVQQAAIACHQAIEQKTALARTGAQLLRASAPTPADSENLLRPTQGAQQTDPTELLRPGDADE